MHFLMVFARVLMKSEGKCSKSCTLCAVFCTLDFWAENGGEKSRGKIEKNSKIFTAEIAALRAREDAEW